MATSQPICCFSSAGGDCEGEIKPLSEIHPATVSHIEHNTGFLFELICDFHKKRLSYNQDNSKCSDPLKRHRGKSNSTNNCKVTSEMRNAYESHFHKDEIVIDDPLCHHCRDNFFQFLAKLNKPLDSAHTNNCNTNTCNTKHS